MKAIHLDTLEGLPGRFIDRLRQHNDELSATEFRDALIDENPDVQKTIEMIDEYCTGKLIKVYHYTRADVQSIREKGLLCRTGEEIRNDFLNQYGHRFTSDEILLITAKWKSFFGKDCQRQARDERIFFNTTKDAMAHGGAELLLSTYGGEQIYFPLIDLESVMVKLRLIGMPMLVSCAVNTADIKTYTISPWGKIIFSTYHNLLNPQAMLTDVDAYVTKPISPKNIIQIESIIP